jgi:hypothetical protein
MPSKQTKPSIVFVHGIWAHVIEEDEGTDHAPLCEGQDPPRPGGELGRLPARYFVRERNPVTRIRTQISMEMSCEFCAVRTSSFGLDMRDLLRLGPSTRGAPRAEVCV